MGEDRPESEDLRRIIDSARRLGIEIDEGEALQWLAAIAVTEADIVKDERAGVYGHRVAMLDFSDADLAHFRRVGGIVGFSDSPGVETALALSGSAAQSKIQTHPGDCDFFERINIHAPSRAEACARLGQILRNKALSFAEGETFRLIEVKYGSYPEDAVRDDEHYRARSAISWSAEDVAAGAIEVRTLDRKDRTITWEGVRDDPGWCKLDWVVADPVRGQIANASNMLDVTWEGPSGEIEPLDGYLDPYFQEVYLEAESIPLFSKMVKNVSPDALEAYVAQLEAEVRKYTSVDPRNYGKAAKRMYNLFRLNGRYAEAAFLRELFDEPTAALYQIHHVIRTLDEAVEPGSTISKSVILAQVDDAIVTVVDAAEGPEETEIVRHLLDIRRNLAHEGESGPRSVPIRAARDRLLNLVNNFFHDKLTAMPSIASYLEGLAAEDSG